METERDKRYTSGFKDSVLRMVHMAGDNEDRKWQLDRHIPVAFIVGLLLQAAGAVWWGSKMESKQQDLERRMQLQEAAKTEARMSVLEEQLRASKEIQNAMNTKLDRLLEAAYNRRAVP